MSGALAAALWGPLLFAALLVTRVRTPRTGRSVGIAATALVFMVSIALLAFNTTAALLHARLLGRFGDIVGTDGLTAALLPIATGIPFATLVSAPRGELDLRATGNILVVGAATLGGVLANNLVAAAAFWLLSLAPLVREALASEHPSLRRALVALVVTTLLPFVVGCGACAWLAYGSGVKAPFYLQDVAASGALAFHEAWIGALFAIAVVARMGVFPLHFWVPVVASRARGSVALPTIVSPLATITMIRVVLLLCPAVVERAGGSILPLAAASAVYGAILALGQQQGARQLAYVWISLMGAVLCGLVSREEHGVTGALLHQFAVIISITGLWLHLTAVAARTGTMDLRRLGGIVRTAPGLATGYLLLALGTVAFPGTATFLSADLLFRGLLQQNPITAGFLIFATALNGLSLVRTYKRIFLGPPSIHAPDLSRVEDVQPRERWTSVALVAGLLLGGLAPTPLLLLKAGVKRPVAENPVADRPH